MRWALMVAVALIASSGTLATAQQEAAAAQEGALPQIAEAIRGKLKALEQHIGGGQADAIAGQFAPAGEWVDETGRVFVGREQIGAIVGELLASFPGVQMEFRPDLIRSLGPGLVIVDGAREAWIGDSTDRTPGRFMALYLRVDDDWQLSSLREFADAEAGGGASQLAALDWMIGDWLNEDADSEIRLSCRRSEDGNYLLRDFTVFSGGKVRVKSSQRLAWDPLLRQIRSWNFDTDGGFGDGRWTRDGDRWIVRTTSVLSDGRTASAVHVLTPEGNDKVRWDSSVRIVGGELEPDREAVMVRQPPRAELAPQE